MKDELPEKFTIEPELPILDQGELAASTACATAVAFDFIQLNNMTERKYIYCKKEELKPDKWERCK
jgi:hypothetical protein